MLIEKIKNRENGIVLYGIVPPKKDTDIDQIKEISDRQIHRLKGTAIDGLILYDIQDEASRAKEERPFPFMETLDSFEYSREYLSSLAVPKIVYRSVGKYSKAELSGFLTALHPGNEATVFVGAASSSQETTMSMREAYDLRKKVRGDVVLGGVVIPERHKSKCDEHLRVFNKISQGCSFFVSQGVYDVDASKSFLSDYYYYGKKHGIPLVPIIFTFTPCGTTKTLQFMKWLGISIPRWLENELINSDDILQQSVEYCEKSWNELREFSAEKSIPIGCNIESVAIRKAEIVASIELLGRMTNNKT